MRTGNSILAIVCMIAATLTACQKQESHEQLDKDEANGYAIAQELSNRRVQCIAEDASGQLWFGTFRGLNRYDGHEFHQYFCTDDTLGLPDNQIKDILCDSHGRIWVATVNGVARYTDRDCFERIDVKASNLNILKILEDSQGRVFIYNGTEVLRYDHQLKAFHPIIKRDMSRQPWSWGNCVIDASDRIIITESQQLLIYDPTTFKIKQKVSTQGQGPFFYSDLLTNGLMILAGNGCLSIYDTKSLQPVTIPQTISDRITAGGSIVQAAYLLDDNSIILSTSKNGILQFNLLTQTITEGQWNSWVPTVNEIYQDSRRNIWFGTYDKGLRTDYYYKEKFGSSDSYLSRTIGRSSTLALATDANGNLWISTLYRGLFVYHTDTQLAEHIDIAGNPSILHIFCDRDGLIWLSTIDHMMKCRYQGNRLDILNQTPAPSVMDFEQTDDGTVWAATSSNDIIGFPTSGEPVVRQAFNADFCFIPSLLKLRDGRMLISAFFQPITSLNPKTGKFSELNIPGMAKCIRRSVYIPTDMLQDTKGDVWIGTVSNGLLRYSPETNEMTRIAGLSCSDVSSIEEDLQGNIWIATMKGLNRWNRQTGRITSLYKADGLNGDEFCDRASCRLPDGCLVFGSTDGITMFNPADIDTLRQIPIRFCDLRIHNQIVHPSEDGPIKALLDSCCEVRLSHSENSFSISFTALDFSDYERVHYYYKMDGFDNDWIDAGNNHTASYANLPTGSYTFRVKTTDNASDEANSEERTLRLTVDPAPANSWWAWLIYLTLAAAIFYYLYRNARRVVAARRAARQAEMEKEQELRTNQMNMSFFANIAHEFRTPLTMIAGPVGQLVKSNSLSNEDRGLLNITHRNILRMFKLVNQLMDFNKLENDTLRLSVEKLDVIEVINGVCDYFIYNAHERNVTINRYGMEDVLMAWTDGDKLEKILTNLISNALKFTPRGGYIDVSLDVDDNLLKVSVADTGKGIPEDQLENIFKRYYQLNNQTKGIINWGTGIGLYYSRRLAELHHGSLTVANRQEGSGAVFTLIYPINEAAYTETERQVIATDNVADNRVFDTSSIPQSEQTTESTEDTRPTILIVDDDTEIINYMRVLFSRDYRLITCLDAETALEEMRAAEPNLVLSDVAMPGKDGYELCQEIKQDIQLSHIPVILVTAKITADNQIEGLNVGADAYVTKPFEPAVLSALIQSQLKNRARIRKLLAKATTTEDEQVEDALSSQDKHFMEELYKLMEEELSNSELDVTRITKLLLISRTKLYYKIKGLTGETPSNFFRTYKLNRAAELLKSGEYTVSEIADKCGFSTQSHFSVVFKKQFGVTPTEYKG